MAMRITKAILGLMLSTAMPAYAATPTMLGSAASFGVLAGSTVTNTGPTTVLGNVGVAPGTAITGFPLGIAAGTLYAGGDVPTQAQTDLASAYGIAASLSGGTNLSGQNLGGLVLMPGIYKFDASAGLTGDLTLDALNDPNAEFIFQIGSTLTTASASSIILADDANAADVFFQVGSSATLGTGSAFAGSILALTSITLDTGASLLDGRALALNGAVTLDSNTIVVPTAAAAVPEPGSWAMMLVGFGLVGFAARVRNQKVSMALA